MSGHMTCSTKLASRITFDLPEEELLRCVVRDKDVKLLSECGPDNLSILTWQYLLASRVVPYYTEKETSQHKVNNDIELIKP